MKRAEASHSAAPGGLASCIYRGYVRHARTAPVDHRFDYSLFLIYLDLGEIEQVFRPRWLWSAERFNVASYRRSDYLGNPSRPLADCVRERVRAELGSCPEGPVRMLTHLRYLGLGFNPVTFYYVFEPGGEDLHSVVAEITNTPWGERHSYVLAMAAGTIRGGARRFGFDKVFHVSPFFSMDHRYAWEFAAPGEQLYIHMENHTGGEHVFSAGLDLRRHPISARSMAGALVRHPWMTGKVMLGIYWQAFRLWIKRVPFHTHPDKLDRSPEHG